MSKSCNHSALRIKNRKQIESVIWKRWGKSGTKTEHKHCWAAEYSSRHISSNSNSSSTPERQNESNKMTKNISSTCNHWVLPHFHYIHSGCAAFYSFRRLNWLNLSQIVIFVLTNLSVEHLERINSSCNYLYINLRAHRKIGATEIRAWFNESTATVENCSSGC